MPSLNSPVEAWDPHGAEFCIPAVFIPVCADSSTNFFICFYDCNLTNH